MLEFKSRALKFKFNEEEYKVNFPTVKQVRDYQSKFEGDHESVDVVLDFLQTLGLGREIGEQLEVDHLTTIVTNITETSAKK